MQIETKIDSRPEMFPLGNYDEGELKRLLGDIYDNQLFLSKEDLKVLRYLGQKGDHDKSPKIDN